jgi:hypothetical protein
METTTQVLLLVEILLEECVLDIEKVRKMVVTNGKNETMMVLILTLHGQILFMVHPTLYNPLPAPLKCSLNTNIL